MFGGIADRYDLMNRLMTFGLDGRWRRAAALVAGPPHGASVLDVCCGTGDLTLELARLYPEAAVVGLDFTSGMLAHAREKAARHAPEGRGGSLVFVEGDLLELPFDDDSFAAVTVAWGVRNVPDVHRAFREMCRVTRPGGRVVCLESIRAPQGARRWVQDLWMGAAVPLLGRFVSGDAQAYAYLPASVQAFPRAGALASLMVEAGLQHVRYRRFALGSVALHVGEVTTTSGPDAERQLR